MTLAHDDSADELKINLAYAAGIGAIALAILFALKFANRDVDFCKGVFKGLISGNPSVEKSIDWPNLTAVGKDVGQEYRRYRLDKDRINYRASFVQAFAQGFKFSGGGFHAFDGWRVTAKSDRTVTVAADYKLKSKTLLFVIPATGEQKLLAMRWSDQPEQISAPVQPATTAAPPTIGSVAQAARELSKSCCDGEVADSGQMAQAEKTAESSGTAQ